VRDDPEHPDPGFAELYGTLEDATELEPWLGWAEEAEPPVLYLGVGAGRLAAPLAKRGIRLVAVDAHPGMLERLAGRRLPIELVESRIEDLDLLPRRFDLAIAPSNILYSQARLRGAARHLREGGRLALELANPHWLFAGPPGGVKVIELTRERAWIEVDYPGGYRQQASFELVWPEEVEDWLAEAGLELLAMRGGGEGLEDSPSFFVLSRR
jgi:SAM-dependent methyltransferase